MALLPNTNLASAMIVAERAQQAVADLEIIHQDGISDDRVTVSMGAAAAHYAQYKSPESLFSTAEWALAKAEAEGRNRCFKAHGPKRDEQR